MKKIISMMMIAAMAMFATSCDDTEDEGDEYGVTGDKYVGTMTLSIPGMDNIPQSDVVFYVDEDDDYASIMMPEVSFMSGLMPNLDMALISLPLTGIDPETYSASSSQMVGLYDHLPLINDVIKGISNVEIMMFESDRVYITFDCSISTSHLGDVVATITYDGLEYGEVVPEGFYITISTGESSVVEGVEMTYYEGDNTLVIDGFKYNTAMPMGSTLVIDGLSASEASGVTTITGEGITIQYSIMGQPCTSDITSLRGNIESGEALLDFYIYYGDFNYPCSYNGAITVEEGSYSAQ